MENNAEHTQSCASIPVWPETRNSQHVTCTVLTVCTHFYYVKELFSISVFCSYYYQHNVNTTGLYYRRNDQRDIWLFLNKHLIALTSVEGYRSNTNGSSSTAQHHTAQHSTAQHSTAQHRTAQHSSTTQLSPPSSQRSTELRKAAWCRLNPEQAR